MLLWYLLLATAFTGYILPWGQMSFWRATVITNLLRSVPFTSSAITKFLWRSSVVSNLTLKRFFVLHYAIPGVIVSLIYLHIKVLHFFETPESKTYTPVSDGVYVNSYPQHLIKNVVYCGYFTVLLCAVLFVYPYTYDNPVNNIGRTSSFTPSHIVPE
jgi:ubiquinol-cytochrome c reductase cytochrome b subunit